MGKDRDKKIVVGQPNNLEHIQRCGFRQFRDDRGGVKLTAFCVPGKTDIVKHRSNAARQAEGPRDHFSTTDRISASKAPMGASRMVAVEVGIKMGSSVDSA
jgi:hypothetical protein